MILVDELKDLQMKSIEFGRVMFSKIIHLANQTNKPQWQLSEKPIESHMAPIKKERRSSQHASTAKIGIVSPGERIRSYEANIGNAKEKKNKIRKEGRKTKKAREKVTELTKE